MENRGLDIEVETRIFTAPGKALCRISQWHILQRNSGSHVDSIIVISESIGDNIHSAEICVDIMRESLKNYYFDESYFVFEEREKLENKIRNVFLEINRTLYSLRKNENMGVVSMLAAVVHDDSLIVGNAGICGSVLLRECKLEYITKRTFPFPLILTAADQLSPDSPARRKAQRNFLGNSLPPLPEITEVNLREEDIVLFFSHGIKETQTDREINEAVSSQNRDMKESLTKIITACVKNCRRKDMVLYSLRVHRKRLSSGGMDQR